MSTSGLNLVTQKQGKHVVVPRERRVSSATRLGSTPLLGLLDLDRFLVVLVVMGCIHTVFTP